MKPIAKGLRRLLDKVCMDLMASENTSPWESQCIPCVPIERKLISVDQIFIKFFFLSEILQLQLGIVLQN